METYNQDELFRLHSGQYIMDERLSDIMYKLAVIKPERAFQDDSTGYSWDEAGMADLFSELYQHDTRFCPEAKSWFTYEDGVWKRDVGSLLVSAKVKEFTRLLSLYCGEISDDEIRKNYMRFVSRMGDRRFRDRLIKDAADSMRIEAEIFDSNPYLINCLNGTFDLKEMSFREHRYDDYLTMQTRFSGTVQYDKVRCHRWEQFVDEITEGNKDKADYLQRAMGYTIIGRANEECMFILFGPTSRNGKSTFLNTIEYMLGDYATVAPVELICKGREKNPEAANPTLAGLKGRRLVTMSENDDAGKLNESIIKQYTGGEEVSARQLYQATMTYLPQFTMWLSCNDLPAVRDKSLFASDRLRLVEFTRHFAKNEQDPDLKAFFERQDSMQGIFTWLLAGYLQYRSRGLSMTKEMEAPIRKYEKDNDVILQFLEEKCEYDSGANTKVKLVYDTYKIWAKSNGYGCMSNKKFIQNMEKHPDFYDRIDTGHANMKYFYGLKLV